MNRIFIGYDPRQPVAYNVLQHSIIRHASEPVAITPLVLSQLPLKRRGLTEFTFSRFLVPALCDFMGQAIFMDADMVVQGDVIELFKLADTAAPVSVVKDQPQFEWASMMVFSNGLCRKLTPEYVETATDLFDFGWVGDRPIGELPAEWNHCVGYKDANINAKLLHFTQGLPVWYETKGEHHEDLAWEAERRAANATVSWKELMGTSVHAKPTLQRLFRRLTEAA